MSYTLAFLKAWVWIIRGSLIFGILIINRGITWHTKDTYHPDELHSFLRQTTSPSYLLEQDDLTSFVSDSFKTQFDDGSIDEHGLKGQNVRFERISIEHGLSQSTIYSIFQDKSGFLWFGTEDGLNKYDGYGFEVYRHDPDDPQSLSDNTILSIFEDHYGVLWIGTYGRGLNRFDRDSNQFTRYRNNPSDPASLVYDTVTVINEDATGNLWIGTWDGLDKYDRESDEFIHYKHDPDDRNSLSHNTVTAIHLDRAGDLWIGTFGGGLNRYDESADQFIPYRHDIVNPNRLSSDYVTSICEDQNGYLWIGTADRGLNKFDPDSEEFTQLGLSEDYQESVGQDSITTVQTDRSGIIWIGTDGNGLNLLDPSTGKFLKLRNDQGDGFSLSLDYINEIFVDRSGIIWVGTFGGGINKYDPLTARFIHYRHIPGNPNSLSANSVMSISMTEDGNLWIGIFGGGFDFLDREEGRISHYKHNPNDPNSLSEDYVWYVLEDRLGIVWIGTTGGGLNRFDPISGEFTRFIHDPENPNSLSMDYVNVIYEDRDGFLWIGTNGGGLDRFDRKTGEFYHYLNDPDTTDSLSGNQIWDIMEDRTGRLWIGTGGGGISVLDQETGKFSRFMHDPDDPTSLGDTDVFSIYEDREGTIWIGTYGSGLDRFDLTLGEFKHYRESDGLPNNVVYGILEDEQGYLWLSTNLGLSRFDPKSESFKNFDVSDGLQSNEFNVGASLSTETGEIFFGGINGLTSFYPGDIQETAYMPPVVLTALSQGGKALVPEKSVETLDDIVLDWSNNNFEFEYVALNFSHPEKSQYAYKLEGFDQDWNQLGATRYGRYTNLPGGTYTLRLIATNSDGIWNEDGASIKVRVVKPFWETWWFIGIITLVVMAGVATGYRFRIRSVEARSEELENQVKVRTDEINRRRLELEALYHADEVIDQYITLDNRLRALVDVAIDILNADKSSIFVRDQTKEKFTVKVARGFSSDAIEKFSFKLGEGIVKYLTEIGEPVIVEDALNEPLQDVEEQEFEDLVLAEDIHSYLFLPIKIANEMYGVFNVSFCEPNAISEDEKRLFMTLTQRAALSIQNAHLFEQLRDLAITEERSRLARDLHDSAKQKAFAALAQLGAANGMLDRSPDIAKDHLLEAEELVYEVLQELIILIQEMYPVTLKEKGLVSTVHEYVFEWENQCDIVVNVKIENERKLPLEIEQTLYRVIQESLANIARHSKANHVDISITFNIDSVEVVVADDGVGFKVNKRQTGLGLRSMHERVDLIKGDLNIDSAIGQGTRIVVTAPVNLRTE